MLLLLIVVGIVAIGIAARRLQMVRRKRVLRAERQQRRAEQAAAWERVVSGKPSRD